MKKLILIIAFLLFSPVAHAVLIDNGDGTITQIRNDGSVLMWLQDANYPGGQITQADAIALADGLTFAGHSDWRLPVTFQDTQGGYLSSSEMGDLYYNELGNTAGNFINSGPFLI